MTTPNPAARSASIESLFPPGVAAAHLTVAADPRALFDVELAAVANAVPKRVAEFAGGRLCARRALESLGVAAGPLPVNPDRTARWPADFVGSITHTRGLCAAVAGPRERFTALGLDAETASAATPDLWPQLLTAAERKRLVTHAPERRAAVATTIFSAKEAYYKAQFTLTGAWLDFEDVEIDLVPDGAGDEHGTFRIRIVSARRTAPTAGAAGRYRRERGFVLTGVGFERAPKS